MTGVGDRMVAGVVARAHLAALGWARAARHRRIDDRRSARARELVKAHPGARLAVALVAQLLAPENVFF